MSKVRKSILLISGQNYIGFALQLLASIVIARLLTPAEIGIYSVAMVFLGFAYTFRDFGVANYLIQEKDLTPDKIRSAFAMTLITGWTLAIAIWLGSGYLAEFYHEPGIKTIMMVISLNFLLIPFGVIPMAYMNREMDFLHIAFIRVASNITSTSTSIWLAYSGFSFLSMAWGSVAGIVCTFLLAQLWRPRGLPLLPGLKEIRKVVSFGSLSSLVMIFSDVSQGAPDMIMGRLSGMSMVGYFGRAMGLLTMFDKFVMGALWSVALPHFAEQSRKEGGIKDNFLNSMTYVTALAWPFYICLGLLAHPVILVMYGAQWEASVPLLRILCIYMVILSPFLLMSSMMIAIGQIKQSLYLLAIHVPVRITLLLLATPFGLEAVGFTFILSSLIDITVYFFQSRLILHVSMVEILKALRKSAGVAAVGAIFPLFIFIFGDDVLAGNLLLQLILDLTGCFLGWLAGLFLFRHPLRLELESLFKMAKSFLSPSK